jgi:aminoglycoside phosphotransferase (APT) family kinase protein
VQAELKGVCLAEGRWRLERAYWSCQEPDAHDALGVRARTLTADFPATGPARLDWLQLPNDPRLSAVAQWLAQRPPGESVRLLRYVPLRRLTFLRTDAQGRACIGKFKRRSRFAEAFDLLGTVDAAVRRLQAQAPFELGFRVAAPLDVDASKALYFQSCLAGTDLAARMGAADALAWMREVGRRQQQLQRLDTRSLPVRGPEHQLAQARSDLAWIAWMRPELASSLAALEGAVEAMPAWHDAAAGFCHGDLVCSQFLVPEGGPADPTAWGLTDFDLCHRGDPCRDLAILLASLDEDVALLAGEGVGEVGAEVLAEACLEGVRREAARWGQPPPDAQRLRWQRLCAELYYLGLMLKKDRYRPALFARRLARAQSLAHPGACP